MGRIWRGARAAAVLTIGVVPTAVVGPLESGELQAEGHTTGYRRIGESGRSLTRKESSGERQWPVRGRLSTSCGGNTTTLCPHWASTSLAHAAPRWWRQATASRRPWAGIPTTLQFSLTAAAGGLSRRTRSRLLAAARSCGATMASSAAIELVVWEFRANRQVRVFPSRCGAKATVSIQLGCFRTSSNDRGPALGDVSIGTD